MYNFIYSRPLWLVVFLMLLLAVLWSRWDELAFIGLTVVFAVVVNTGGKVIGKKMARG